MQKILSPLLEREAMCRLVRSVDSEVIRAGYRESFGYDPAEELAALPNVQLFECSESGLQFFLPLTAAGREALYRRLETFDWNYKEKKWEHDQAMSLIAPHDKVLDVGCGRAAFLVRAASEANATVTGLELNQSAAAFGRERGVEVLTETIEQHARLRPAHYDVVASFQVLEHVTEPAAFLRACVAALKSGGRLVVGVPNNDSFLRLPEDNWLNMPPHHMTLWSRACLEGLAERFELRHVSTHVEPLQEREWYQATFERRHLKGRLRRFIYYRLHFDDFFRKYVEDAWMTIPGHTIMAVFEKAVPAQRS